MPLNWNEYQAAQSQQHYPPGVIVSAPSSSQGVPVHSAPVISAPVAKPAAVTSTPAKAAAPTVSSTSSSSSSIPDNIDIRELGKRWAISQGFTQDKLMEFDQLMGLVTSTYISSQRVINIQELGRGSFGKIYYSKFDNGPVAVKVIESPGQSHNIKAKMRELLLELNILVRVRHPNVVTFWGSSAYFPDVKNKPPGQSQDPYISMVFELCDGGSLQQALFNPQQKLSTTMKISFALQVAQGMAYLHRRRADDRRCIIHRDLNTRNILVTTDGIAKVADFGCARVLDETGQLTTTTISGTPSYMAPEQLQGQSLTEAVDVWSFAVVLWEMMAERRPWEGPLESNVEGLKDALINKHQVLPIKAHHGFPPPYIHAIQTGMALKDSGQPKERPTMFEMVQLLIEAKQKHAEHPSS